MVREKALTLTLVHTHVREGAEIIVRIRDGKADSVRQTVLTHARLNAHNTFEAPNVVTPKTTEVKEGRETMTCVLPPTSVVRLDAQLECSGCLSLFGEDQPQRQRRPLIVAQYVCKILASGPPS